MKYARAVVTVSPPGGIKLLYRIIFKVGLYSGFFPPLTFSIFQVSAIRGGGGATRTVREAFKLQLTFD